MAKFDLSSLNKEQREAVETLQGPLLVLAGAGTGKTRVITARIVNLIANGIDPQHILAVTFTNKAAKEMKERLLGMLPKSVVDKLTVGTFHSFCIRLLHQHIHLLGYSTNFAIADDTYQEDLLRTIVAEHKISGEGCNPSLWQALISKAKGEMIAPAGFAERFPALPRLREATLVYETYQRRMKQMNLVDFDDILNLVLKTWENFPEVLAQHREMYQYLLIDEYQDTNIVQLNLVTTLAAPKNNLCVVGDDDQSIYAWRGAVITNILAFDQQFPQAKVIRLEQNYRSMGNILNAANHVIAKNKTRHRKFLRTTKNEGEKIKIVRCQSDDEEAECIAQYVTNRYRDFERNYNNFAVLFRSNKQARLLEVHFRRANIPYTLIGTHSFFKTKEIQDIISFLQIIHNPNNDLSLLRIINVPPRHIGDTTIEHLHDFSRTHKMTMTKALSQVDFLQLLTRKTCESIVDFQVLLTEFTTKFKNTTSLAQTTRELLSALNYREAIPQMYTPRESAMRRLENIEDFLLYMDQYEKRSGPKTLKTFLDSLSLLDGNDQPKEQEQAAVSLITVHSSKGLEFPAVIIAGMERDLFPNERAIQEGMLEEERRLFYVAVTRAQVECVLTYAENRKLRGLQMRQHGSIFLDELPDDLCEFVTPKNLFKPIEKDDLVSALRRIRDQL